MSTAASAPGPGSQIRPASRRRRMRKPSRQRGFSLIELMAVAAIILLLSAIVAYASTGTTSRAQLAAAETALERSVLAQRDFAATAGRWAAAAELPPRRDLTFTGAVSTGPEQVSVVRGDSEQLGVAVKSDSGQCLARVLDDPLLSGAERYLDLAEGTPCSGGGALDTDEGDEQDAASSP